MQTINGVIGPDTRIGAVDDPVKRPPAGTDPLTLTLHSREIIATTLGREKTDEQHAILGWSRAAFHYIGLLNARRRDNPFADIILIHAESDLAERRTAIRKETAAINEKKTEGLDPGLWSSRQSLRVAMDTGNAHARSLAGFISEVDQLVRLHKASVSTGDSTLAQIGRRIRALQKTIRQAIYVPVHWNSHLLPVTRDEIRAGQHKHLEALQKAFGGLPSDDIMSRKYQPENVPYSLHSRTG